MTDPAGWIISAYYPGGEVTVHTLQDFDEAMDDLLEEYSTSNMIGFRVLANEAMQDRIEELDL